jgi:hypothetical protein
MPDRDASCSCGQLRVAVTGEPVRVSVCHCLACQRRTGSAFGYQARFRSADVTISGRATQWGRVADDGETSCTFHFCPECGTTVYYVGDQDPEFVAVAAGAFADPSFPPPQRTVWEDRRHAWVTLPPGVRRDDPPQERVPTPVERVREMFDRVMVAKNAALIPEYYDPEFVLQLNGRAEDQATFAAGHERVFETDISYAVEYDEDAWVQTGSEVAGRVWITTTRPGQPPTRTEVVLVARLRDGRLHRLWELTRPG